MIRGYAFISYAREDSHRVDRLQRALEAAGVLVWRDTADLWPGEDWRAKIRRAITDDAFVFIACFSRVSVARRKGYQNEELTLAIEQLRLRRPDDPWFIPVRLDECDIPDRDIGGGRTLASIHRADLFGRHSRESTARLVKTVQRILEGSPHVVEHRKGDAASAVDYHGSHRGLLQWLLRPQEGPSAHQPGIDAIIVPTTRPPAHLDEAVGLATALGCTLVTLHSGGWTTAANTAQHLPPSVDLIPIAVPDPAQMLLPPWETSRLLVRTGFDQRTDLSAKRNLGLVLSRLLGWSRVLFLDDDITALNPVDIRLASGLLDTHNAVGLDIEGFPDDSVVSHAFRNVGGAQQSFISAKALVVLTERDNSFIPSFFPEIFHDDWFFLLDGERLQPLAAAGRVMQRPYDPFRTTGRAREEELGDALTEGIFWMLDQGRTVSDCDLAHWREFLAKRRRFLEQVLSMAERAATIESAERTRMVDALQAALERLKLLTPQLCLNYLRAWSNDRQRWQSHLDQLPTHQSAARAIALLSGPTSNT